MKNYLLIMTLVLFSCKEKKEPTAHFTNATNHQQQDSLKESQERGGIIYTNFCMQCHMANGLGIPGTFPPLAKSNWLTEKRTESIHAVKFGQKGKIEVNGKQHNSLHFKFLSSDETLPDNKKLNTDIWYDAKTLIWLKAQFIKQGNWEYRLKKFN